MEHDRKKKLLASIDRLGRYWDPDHDLKKMSKKNKGDIRMWPTRRALRKKKKKVTPVASNCFAVEEKDIPGKLQEKKDKK